MECWEKWKAIAKRSGVSYQTFYYRVQRGWDYKHAATTPTFNNGQIANDPRLLMIGEFSYLKQMPDRLDVEMRSFFSVHQVAKEARAEAADYVLHMQLDALREVLEKRCSLYVAQCCVSVSRVCTQKCAM